MIPEGIAFPIPTAVGWMWLGDSYQIFVEDYHLFQHCIDAISTLHLIFRCKMLNPQLLLCLYPCKLFQSDHRLMTKLPWWSHVEHQVHWNMSSEFFHQAKKETSLSHSVHGSIHCRSCSAVFHFQPVAGSVSDHPLLPNNLFYVGISDWSWLQTRWLRLQ